MVKPQLSTRGSSIKHIKCASCGSSCKSTSSEGWDEYAIRLGISRPLTILLLVKFDRALDQGLQRLVVSHTQSTMCGSVPTNAPKFTPLSYSNTSNAELAELNFQALAKSLPNVSHGTTNIHGHCTKCGSSFEFTVADQPRTNHKPLTYCPYCATPTLVITPSQTLSYIERSAEQWSHLAEVYSPKPETQAEQIIWLADIQAKYHFWENHSTAPTFAQFMADLPNMMAQELSDRSNKLSVTPKQIMSNNRPIPTKNKQTKRRLVIKVKSFPEPASMSNPSKPLDPNKLYSGANAQTPLRQATMVYPTCMLCKCEQPSKTLTPLCEPCQIVANKRRISMQQNSTKGSC